MPHRADPSITVSYGLYCISFQILFWPTFPSLLVLLGWVPFVRNKPSYPAFWAAIPVHNICWRLLWSTLFGGTVAVLGNQIRAFGKGYCLKLEHLLFFMNMYVRGWFYENSTLNLCRLAIHKLQQNTLAAGYSIPAHFALEREC